MDRIKAQHLWVVSVDGKRKRQLTSDPKFHESEPKWSKNGEEIIFWRGDSVHDSIEPTLWSIRTDGSRLHKIRNLKRSEK